MHELLTADEEQALAVQAAAGDRAARDRLCLCNRLLVRSIARSFRYRATLPWGDLLSEGIVGLLSAIDAYRPSEGVRFAVYARNAIRGHMIAALHDDATIRVPKYVHGLVNREDAELALWQRPIASKARLAKQCLRESDTRANVEGRALQLDSFRDSRPYWSDSAIDEASYAEQVHDELLALSNHDRCTVREWLRAQPENMSTARIAAAVHRIKIRAACRPA